MREVFIIKTVDVPESVQYFDIEDSYSNDVEYWTARNAHNFVRNPKFAYQFDSYSIASAVIPLLGADMYQIDKYFVV